VPDLDSLGVLLALIVISVGVTMVILYLMKLIREKYSRRKYR
jgi:Tfp pilus assembly protein PilV